MFRELVLGGTQNPAASGVCNWRNRALSSTPLMNP
jgi:hypothetical protein